MQQHTSRLNPRHLVRFVGIGLSAFLFAGCMGEVGLGEGGDPSKQNGAGVGANDGPVNPDESVASGSGLLSCESKVTPPAVTMRRLSNEELQNTIDDLFGLSQNVSGALPPDALVNNFDNNAEANSISALRAQSYQTMAEALAERVVADAAKRTALVGCTPSGAGRDACIKGFVERFGRRTYRRPLTSEEVADYTALAQVAAADTDAFASVKLIITAMLQSPNFLFRPEIGSASADGFRKLDGFERVTRLSYLLFRTTPTDSMLDAAAAGQLNDDAGFATYARGLLSDSRLRDRFRAFTDQWLQLSHIDLVTPVKTVFPAWTDTLGAAMEEQTRRTVEKFAWNESSNFLDIITTDKAFVNAELASLYGVSGGPANNSTWTEMTMDVATTKRVGLLGQAAFLKATSKEDRISPLHRGLWVRAVLMCSTPPPPPPGIPEFNPPLEGETEREAFGRHAANPACAGCHNQMEPIGFGLSKFDGIGKHRETDSQNLAIDDSGFVQQADGSRKAFTGAEELALNLRDNPEVSQCISRQLFRYAFAKEERKADNCFIVDGDSAFQKGGNSMPALLENLVTSPVFGYRSYN